MYNIFVYYLYVYIYAHVSSIESLPEQASMVAHTCKPGISGGRSKEIASSKSAWGTYVSTKQHRQKVYVGKYTRKKER